MIQPNKKKRPFELNSFAPGVAESQGSSSPVSVLCAYYKANEIEMMKQSIHSANGLVVYKKLNLASGLLEAPEILCIATGP